ncbi:unnamed protein product [Protopolystoma xenopodis]|uniref:Uncharacterized protein n=1 Tax=Protopolystoma xenopodis TaxID=117903 RepID=A0A3S5A4I6_9PLAT|nr:unnamed protein product [Protopolystoma xenopodis]
MPTTTSLALMHLTNPLICPSKPSCRLPRPPLPSNYTNGFVSFGQRQACTGWGLCPGAVPTGHWNPAIASGNWILRAALNKAVATAWWVGPRGLSGESAINFKSKQSTRPQQQQPLKQTGSTKTNSVNEIYR